MDFVSVLAGQRAGLCPVGEWIKHLRMFRKAFRPQQTKRQPNPWGTTPSAPPHPTRKVLKAGRREPLYAIGELVPSVTIQPKGS